MNHAGVIQHESEQVYRNRGYALAELDDRHFDALNAGAHVLCLNGYCLDAIDVLPAGSMIAGHHYPSQACVSRGVSLFEQQEMDAEMAHLLDEILA